MIRDSVCSLAVSPRLWWAGVISLLILAVALRIPALTNVEFWLDDMISIGIANQDFLDSLLAAMRFSVHPPGYYVQLNWWMLVSRNDLWIQLNPIVWSVVSVGGLILMTRRITGDLPGLFAGLIWTFSPQSLLFAQNVRMYAMMVAISLGILWLQFDIVERLNRDERFPYGRFVVAAIGQLIVAYSHAAGPLMAAGLGSHLLLAVLLQNGRATALRVFLLQIAVGFLILPVIVNGMMRETQHQPPSSLAEIAYTLDRLVLPSGGNDPIALLGTLLLLGLLLVGLARPGPHRAVAITLFLVPVVANILISVVWKPMFASRFLTLFTPFALVGAAGGFARMLDWSIAGLWPRRLLSLGLAAALIASSLQAGLRFASTYKKPNSIQELGAYLASRSGAGDAIVIANGHAPFWGAAWSLVGPDWGTVLAVQPPANERWEALFEKLGPRTTALLKLRPTTDHIEFDRRTLYAGVPEPARVHHRSRVWVLAYFREDVSQYVDVFERDGFRQSLLDSIRGFNIVLLERP